MGIEAGSEHGRNAGTQQGMPESGSQGGQGSGQQPGQPPVGNQPHLAGASFRSCTPPCITGPTSHPGLPHTWQRKKEGPCGAQELASNLSTFWNPQPTAHTPQAKVEGKRSEQSLS